MAQAIMLQLTRFACCSTTGHRQALHMRVESRCRCARLSHTRIGILGSRESSQTGHPAQSTAPTSQSRSVGGFRRALTCGVSATSSSLCVRTAHSIRSQQSTAQTGGWQWRATQLAKGTHKLPELSRLRRRAETIWYGGGNTVLKQRRRACFLMNPI
jgi:hypothetical protein